MGTVLLDSVRYVTRGKIRRRTLVGFPDPVPDSGQPSDDNYLPHRLASQKPPLGIGLKNTYKANRVWDMEADARFSSGIYLPRLITTPTVPTGAVIFHSFGHAIGQLFMSGRLASGGSTEKIVYWDGTNWADATEEADVGNSHSRASRVVDHEGRAYAVVSGGGVPTSQLVNSTDGTTWSAGTGPGDNCYFLVSDGVNLYADSGTTSILIRKTADESTWSTIATIGSTGRARGMALWGDGSSTPALDLIVGTPDALYHIDTSASTFKLLLRFQHPEGAYTGTLIDTPHGIAWCDGPNVFVGDWSGGAWTYKGLGPEDVDDGVPLEQAGDATWVAYDSTRDELAFAKGGLAASRNQVIYFYSFKTGLISAKMGRNTTANRASYAGIYSSETDGRNRLHWTRDNGTANDSEAVYMDYISENPDVQTSATFATSGSITTSRFDGYSSLFRKGFYKLILRGDSLDATEKVSAKFATNGGALGSSQDMTTSPVSRVWVDGSGTAAGADAYDVYAELTLARDAGTTTLCPKVRSFGYAYLVAALNDDDTPLQLYDFEIDLKRTAEWSSDLKDVEAVKSAIRTTMAKRTVVNLVYGPDTGGVSTKVKILDPIELEEEAPMLEDAVISEAPMPGFVRVICRDIGVK